MTRLSIANPARMLEKREHPELRSIYDFDVCTIDGHSIRLTRFVGRPLLIVNTAGRFSCTSQFAGLERLHRRYSGRGLVVLGFPCHQFAPRNCGSDFGTIALLPRTDRTGLLMMERIDVRGPAANPMFRWLMEQAPGILGTRAIKWNFTKFLVQRDGRSVGRFSPLATPESLVPAIEVALRQWRSPMTPYLPKSMSSTGEDAGAVGQAVSRRMNQPR